MLERGITREEIEAVVEDGEIIESYLDDKPFPSRLVLGWVNGRAIHVVAADDVVNEIRYIITVYEPDPLRWDAEYRTRREP